MKQILTIILLTTSLLAFGQEEPYGYITKEPIVVYGYDQ